MVMRDLVKGGMGLFFPANCLLCGETLESLNRSFICVSCWQSIEWLPPVCCARCGKPISFNENLNLPHICPDCQIEPPYFQKLFSSTLYKGVMAEAIKLFKYSGKRGVIRGFARIIKTCVQRFDLECLGLEAVVPIPLHPKKLRERGYNQAEDVAKVVGRYLSLPLWNDYLVRVRYTKPQTKLKEQERKENIKGAFSVPGKKKQKGEDKKILLVDDVYTTGVTLNEASREMRGCGAEVFSFTLARSP